jgi:hypothetical protein
MLDTRRGEQRGSLLGAGAGEEDSFVADERSPRALPPFAPDPASLLGQCYELGLFVHVAEDPCEPRRLAAPRLRVEAGDVGARLFERFGGGEPDHARSDNSHLRRPRRHGR